MQNIYDGFKENDSTVDVFINMEKAFDPNMRNGLLHKLYNVGVTGRMLDWLYSFLHKTEACCYKCMCRVEQRGISKQKLDCLKVQCCHQCNSVCLLLTFTKK